MSGFSTVCCFVILMLALSDLHLPAEGCSCLPPAAFADIYCGADYAVKARVKRRTTIGNDHDAKWRYTIKIKQIFKLPEGTNATSYLWTQADTAMCGVDLSRSTVYYLVGGLDSQGRLSTHSCIPPTPWRNLSIWKRRQLRKQRRRQHIVCPAIANDVV